MMKAQLWCMSRATQAVMQMAIASSMQQCRRNCHTKERAGWRSCCSTACVLAHVWILAVHEGGTLVLSVAPDAVVVCRCSEGVPYPSACLADPIIPPDCTQTSRLP